MSMYCDECRYYDNGYCTYNKRNTSRNGYCSNWK